MSFFSICSNFDKVIKIPVYSIAVLRKNPSIHHAMTTKNANMLSLTFPDAKNQGIIYG
jgi:hypothetical protein